MSHIKHIAFYLYAVSDLKKARAFYEGVLGLALDHPVSDDSSWVEYDIKGSTLSITDRLPAPPKGAMSAIVFEVDDIHNAYGHYIANGATSIYEPFEAEHCLVAGIADPDGNAIGLHQFKK